MADQNDNKDDLVGHSDYIPNLAKSFENVFKEIRDNLPPPADVLIVSFDDDTVETPREHNERKYPDLMARLDRLQGLINKGQ